MAFPIFLSVVYVVRNSSESLTALLASASDELSKAVSDHELIVVDNGSTDDSVSVLRLLTRERGLPNLQVYALTKEVDTDTASWAGLENALGDFVAVIDPFVDDIAVLPQMLEKATNGAEVVFAANLAKPRAGFGYRLAYSIFSRVYKFLGGVDLAREAPLYRVLSRRVINFILQHPQPSVTYRHLPATAGFARAHLNYQATPIASQPKKLRASADRGLRLLVSTTHAPMRLVTTLSLFGAATNALYSVYVVAIALFKEDVAPGWTSLSLQQSGMFFLISLVLLVLGEYILQMARLSNEGPLYHVAAEFTSARITRRERLNIEDPRQRAELAEPLKRTNN